MTPSFFNPYKEIQHTLNRLPHWEQPAVACAITFRLADSLPRRLLLTWEEEIDIWKTFHPEPWDSSTEVEYHRRFNQKMHEWLDAGYGSCLLRNSANASIVGDALRHFDRQRYLMISFVVMPNHVHAFLAVHSQWPLQKVTHSWKSWSSKQIKMRAADSKSCIWQKDYHDRLIRNGHHFCNVVRYIRANPVRAKLREGEYLLWESDFARAIE